MLSTNVTSSFLNVTLILLLLSSLSSHYLLTPFSLPFTTCLSPGLELLRETGKEWCLRGREPSVQDHGEWPACAAPSQQLVRPCLDHPPPKDKGLNINSH